jgi:hypothetical protein
MPKYYAYFDNGTYKVGCTGGSICVFDQNNTELARFKGLSCIYQGAFRPGTNMSVAKSNVGYLLVYDLDTLSLLRKVNITRIGAQDSGFAFSPSGDLFYNIESPVLSIRTQLTVYDGATFDKIASYCVNDEKIFLRFIETYPDEVYVFGFMRGDSGVYDYPFTAKFADGEIRDIRRIQSNAYPISEWTPWDKNDCQYLHIYKNWETEGFAKESAKSHECLMQEPAPPKITIKHIWEIN